MTPREFTDLAAQVRAAVELGDVVEAPLEAAGRKIGLLFVPLDIARIEAKGERILPELGIAADWALVWCTTTSHGAPFRLLERGEHDWIQWPQLAEELDLFSDDAMVVAAFLAEIARVPHGIEKLEERLAAAEVPA